MLYGLFCQLKFDAGISSYIPPPPSFLFLSVQMASGSLKPGSPRPGARENYYTMLELCRRYNTAVILGSDSHCAADVGCHDQAAALLREMDFPEELVVNRSLKALGEYLECVK